MADDTTPTTPEREPFDDERLLAYALGLDDDPALAAASGDGDVRRRLAALRADIEQVGANVRAAVPEPGAEYTDLGDPRWAGLRDYVTAGAPSAARRGAWHWLRVAVPVAVLALAAGVGVSVIARQGGSDHASISSGATEGVVPQAAPGGSAKSYGAPARLPTADAFALVVVARAGAVRQGYQSFAVVRTLKGKTTQAVRLRVLGTPVEAGGLALLLLKPVSGQAQAGSGGGEGASPGPTALPGLRPAPQSAPVYSYAGEPAYARQLPAGTDPSTVTLP
jgi:hypothetical protein